jgi:hypothetical protein
VKVLLRAVAVLLGLIVVNQAYVIVRSAATGRLLIALGHSPGLAMLTIAGWLLILTAGPVAVVQLWRLRRVGLFLTAVLTGIACVYYLLGLLFFRSPGANVNLLLRAVLINGITLVFLMLPPVRRACS